MASPPSSTSPPPYDSYDGISVFPSPSSPDIHVIAFNRPSKRNALDMRTYGQVSHALQVASEHPSVRCVVLTGLGPYFTAGADISESDSPAYRKAMVNPTTAPVGRFMESILRFPKLLIAAVNGPSVGIGVTLLPHCDICYSSPKATFWTPFVRLAVVPEFCSSLTFGRIMGPGRAAEMLLGGKTMGVEEAERVGLVQEIIKGEDFLEEVYARVRKILDQPMADISLPLFKKMMRKAGEAETEAVYQMEMEELGKRHVKGETRRAVAMLLADKKKAGERTALPSKL